MPRSITDLLQSPETRSGVDSPATGRLDGDDTVWRFQGWKWVTAVAVTGGQTIWYLSQAGQGDRGALGFFLASFVGVYVVFAGTTWAVRRVGVFQYERPWVAIPALVASAVALAAPLSLGDSTGPFLATYLLLLLLGGAVQYLRR